MQRGAPRDESHEPVSIEGPPPLARLAAAMALVDLVWNRIVVRMVATVDEDASILLQRAGVFPRNLAAVAGLIALAVALYTFLRMAGYSGLPRRLAVSSVAGLVLPAFVLALVVQKERLPIAVVIVALLATNALIVLVGTVALRYVAGPRWLASALATTSAAFVLTSLVAGTVQSIAQSPAAGPLSLIAHHGGELAWHALPTLVLVALFRGQKGAPPSEGPPPSRALLGVVVALALLVTGLSLLGEAQLHAHRFETLVYGALRLTLVPESIAWVNGITLGIGLAGALVGLGSSSPARAQLGAASALWLAAGCAPRAPGQLLDFALAGLLLARAAQAVTREGRNRARMTWGPPPAAAAPNP